MNFSKLRLVEMNDLKKLFSLGCLLILFTLNATLVGQEIIQPEEAQKDPDFLLQGEYLGTGIWPVVLDSEEKEVTTANSEIANSAIADSEKANSEKNTIGAQVIARGKGKFTAVFFSGGLPGAGWMREQASFQMEGNREENLVTLKNKEIATATIEKGQLTVVDADNKQLFQLKRIERTSPTLNAKPAKDAVVLFDGSNIDHFPGATLTEMKTLQAGCDLKDKYKIEKIHLEFRLSWKPTAKGQGRSNSGVYIGGIPEIQVLDSFGLEGESNECGGFYKRKSPDVNMCFPPMVWQTYDIEFTYPNLNDEGKPQDNILVTVKHNGVVIHKDYDTRKKNDIPDRKLHLQSHGNKVQYRNIWLVEPKLSNRKTP